MKKPTKPLLISYILFGVAIACVIAAIAVGSSQAKPALETLREAQKTEQSENPVVQPEPQEAVQDAPAEPSVQATTPSQSPSLQEPVQAKEQGGHVPFTQKEVTPGDPESYQNTVGQCPFYEMGGDKGCIPPPDIECNADWSECHPKEQP